MPSESARRRGRPAGVVVDNQLMRTRRKSLAMSQSDLAERARLGTRTVRAAEQGSPVSADTAMQLSVTLGIPYVLLVRKTPDEVHARLLERGYAPLETPEPWIARPELAPLIDVLSDETGATVVIEGQTGIGKSSAARWLANQVRDQFPDGAIWLTAAKLDEPGRLHRVQRDVASCLGLVELLPDADLVTLEAFDRAFATRLWTRRRLLVLDDVRDYAHVERLLDPQQPHWLVVTTASRFVADQIGGDRVQLDRWDPDTADAMLRELITDGRLEADPEGAAALAQRSGGIPLVARNIADTLRRRRYTAPSDYAAELDSTGLEGLGLEEHAKVGALYVFQDRPFSLPFARVATGLSAIGTRLLLEQLSDLYLLREAPAAEFDENAAPRFVLDSASRGLAFWDSDETRRAMDRLIAAAPKLAEEISGEVWGAGTSPDAARRVELELPTWRLILDEASRRIVGPELSAAHTPGDVPPARTDAGDLRVLGQTLRNLRSLLLYHPPEDAGVWLTAALAAARAADNGEDLRDAHWMLMIWWWLGRQRVIQAAEWCAETVAVAERVGPPERIVTAHLFSAGLVRFSHGIAAAEPFLTAAADLDDPELQPHQRACALGSLGAMLLYSGEYARAEAVTSEALEVLGDPSHPADQTLGGELLLNLALFQLLQGKPTPPTPAIRRAARTVLSLFTGSTFLEIQVAHLCRLLGVDLGLATPTANQAFYGVPPQLIHSRLLRIMQTVVDLGGTVEGVGYDGAKQTDLGPFSLITTPFAPREGRPPMAMMLCAPVEPLRSLFQGDALRAAMEFTAAVRGEAHPTYRALAALED